MKKLSKMQHRVRDGKYNRRLRSMKDKIKWSNLYLTGDSRSKERTEAIFEEITAESVPELIRL